MPLQFEVGRLLSMGLVFIDTVNGPTFVFQIHSLVKRASDCIQVSPGYNKNFLEDAVLGSSDIKDVAPEFIPGMTTITVKLDVQVESLLSLLVKKPRPNRTTSA